jgi:cell fate regulator YaaT (PSP1 superfamily)
MRGFTNVEQLLGTMVPDCPNNGSGPCGLMHTCVEYETDEDGNIRVKD